MPSVRGRAASRVAATGASRGRRAAVGEALLELIGSPRSARGCSSTGATTSSSSRAPSAGPVSTLPSCGCVPPRRGLAVTLDGQGRVGVARPVHAAGARDPRGGAQRRLRRRRAARLHRLPQLRQPREAGDRLGARRGDRGDGAARARRSASRSSPATSRSTTTRTAARSTRPPSSAVSGSCRTCAASRAAGARAT